MSELQEATKEFLIESHENLDQLDTDLVGLETSTAPTEAVGRIFRALHTIKGSCSFLGFPHLEAVAHAGETLLGQIRDGKQALSPAITEALLHVVDAIRKMLGSVEDTGNDGTHDERDLIDLLNQLADDPAPAKTVSVRPGQTVSAPAESSQDFSLAGDSAQAKTVPPRPGPAAPAPRESIPDFSLAGDAAQARTLPPRPGQPTPAPREPVADFSLAGDTTAQAKTLPPRPGQAPPRPSPSVPDFSLAGETAAQSKTLPPRPGQAAAKPAVSYDDFSLAGETAALAPADSEPVAPSEGSAVYDASVRIHVDLLDKLMTIAGEIVLARNQILQYGQQHGDPSFQNTCRQLNLITTELQEHVMKTRLQPLGNVWNRFPRLVHDTARACGKKVRLEVEGSETELDKTLIEAIRDPLTHLVRNAIDHGIEVPERRRALSKPEEGCVRLRAYHEGGQVNVEISDDGGGIDPTRVRQRAVEQRLVSVDQADRMGAQTLLGLIFLPGFSTAPAVTTLSGRGVGMDVVKTNIEKIGGSVDVHSTIGRGTTVRIRIPLTLAIIKVLVVTSAGDRYAIPQVSIVELVRVEGEKARKGIQRVHDVLVYRYRDQLLPLVNLNDVLKLDETVAREDDAVNIVVLQAAGQQFGLVVDRINDTQEIVVKPLWKHLKSLACFAGATVMGGGEVALILDVFGLAQRAGAISDQQNWAAAEAQPAAERLAERPSMLLIEGRDRGRMAIPLDKVARLEEFPSARVERVADRRVVQYRGRILPLLDVDGTLRAAFTPDQPRNAEIPDNDRAIQVVVYADRDRSVGLIVERILDIVDRDGDTQGPSSRPGVECTAVIQGRVTELLDVDALIATMA